jgi:hypothetical protein
MNKIYPVLKPTKHHYTDKRDFRVERLGWTWRTAGGVVGLGAGIIAALCGSVLTAVSWFTTPGGTGLYAKTIGTALLLSTIPVLIFGACCLDWEETRQRSKDKK